MTIKSVLWLIAGLPLAFAATVISGCDSRDPEAEFQTLSHWTYSDPSEGIEAAEEYLNHFKRKDGSRYEDVSEILHQYTDMKDILDASCSSYTDFIDRISEIGDPSFSSYEGVRNTWSFLFEMRKKELLGSVLDRITKDVLQYYLQSDAREICRREFTTWDPETCDVIEMDEPELTSDGFGKRASGVFRVYVRGNIIGISTSSAKIWVKGYIKADAYPNPEYKREDYSIVESPSSWF